MVEVLSFGIEPVGDDARRYCIPLIFAAHCHNWDRRVLATYMRDQFDSRHERHVEVGDEQIWRRPVQVGYRADATFCRGHVVPGERQEHPQTFPDEGVVVDYKSLSLRSV